MKLEVGKYYKTRDGRKVGPLKDWPDRIWKFKCGESYYKSDGHHEYDDYDSHVHECDLIAEWTDEPTAIDHLRKAAELFLSAGNDKAAFDVLGVVLDHE